MLKKAPKAPFIFKGVMPMKKILALICAFMLIVGYAVCECDGPDNKGPLQPRK